MKRDYIRKKKKLSKKVYITICVIAAVFVSVAFIGKYFAVDFIFDNYVVKPALEMAKEGNISEMMKKGEANAETETLPEVTEIPENNEINEISEKPADKTQTSKTTTGTTKELSISEIAYKVLESPELMARLEAMVSSADKSAVLSIAKSCFTREEKKYYLTEMASKGLTPQIKSEMMGIVSSRMTGDKKATVLSLFSKYVDALRPYLK